MNSSSNSDASNRQDSVRVVCRVRPQNDLEIRSGGLNCLNLQAANAVEMDYDGGLFNFPYDRVFASSISQKDVFDYVGAPIIQEIFSGYNSTIIAYGQTSSGKTYTMEGPDIRDATLQGIIPRCFEALFEQVKSQVSLGYRWTVKASYVEIYLERIRDLLDDSKVNLQVREDAQNGVYVAGATEINVSSTTDVMNIMSHGAQLRATAATGMNEGSSRSHSVFFIKIAGVPIDGSAANSGNNQLSKKTAKLVLVDLAGSEMVRKTHATGQTLEEAKTINKSLSALGQVINALTDEKATHIPYRDSKLTRMLQDSLGGNSKTTLVINISPSSYNSSETLSTLRFGSRAKSVKNQAVVNEENDGNEMRLLLLRAEGALEHQKKNIAQLEDRMKSIKNLSLSMYVNNNQEGSGWRLSLERIIVDSGGSIPAICPPEPVSNNAINGVNKDDLLREARDLVMHSHAKYKIERERADKLEKMLMESQAVHEEEKKSSIAVPESNIIVVHDQPVTSNESQDRLVQLISIHREVLNRLYCSEVDKMTLKRELQERDHRIQSISLQLQQAARESNQARNEDWSSTVSELKRIRDRMIMMQEKHV